MRRAAGAVVVGLAWIYTAAHFAMTGVRQPLGNFYGDFLASFPSWRVSVLTGRLDMYRGSLAAKWAMKFGATHPLWHYGPVEHLVTLPLFAFRDLRTGYIAWLIATYAFVAGILVLACFVFHSGRAKWLWRSVVRVAILNYGPLYEALTQRNIEIFELLLIFAAFALFSRGRAGGAIGFAAMTKFLPLIFVPYFLLKRQLRALTGAVITIAAIAHRDGGGTRMALQRHCRAIAARRIDLQRNGSESCRNDPTTARLDAIAAFRFNVEFQRDHAGGRRRRLAVPARAQLCRNRRPGVEHSDRGHGPAPSAQ
jgi:hypothetical protein